MHQFLPKQSVTDNSIDLEFNPKEGMRIPTSCRSPACFDMISRWRQNCRDNHKTCTSNSTKRMPTRVLDIGDQTSYATLSYCWGNSTEYAQPITTTGNLKYKEAVIYLTTLPPVFQDAIIIARKLGYKYLWVDSLCIIQDSTDDWNTEASKMQQYYKGSSANIVAAAAKNPAYGIFDSADRLREKILYSHMGCGLSQEFEYRRIFVEERAWTLQEELISPCSVIYTDTNIRWLCSEGLLSEACFPDGCCGAGYHDEAKKQLFAFPKYTRSEGDGDEVHDMYFAWWELSKQTDRLPAIAGLAKEFGDRIKTPTDLSNEVQYYCGLWKKDFVRGLCWNGGHGARIQQDKSEYVEGIPVPSWSWAALDPGRIGKDRFLFHRHIALCEWGLVVDDDRVLKNFEVRVEDGEGVDDYGACKLHQTVLVLQGVCGDFHTHCEPHYISSPWSEFDDYERKRFSCTLDEQSGRNDGYPEFRIQMERYTSMWPGGYDEYRRVGLVELPDYSALKGWKRNKVAII
ncbi:Heterokaryon incompatibility protein (HET) domain containing protein [Hyaloscypha variabilis]